ncbi:bifunctional ADP-dependent NAD(P)H-hydrate dehydratase/NAD(P)H-hydrate epimerase [Effusibacillus pohliae]|uniref:bifunctional ADP-dependent NAD(P)H-hydrate dehydratase/NAD(P)H-hydrate epimerase n=1 Tax=Effusibacillus pohliae TaxID=232270 RepID=UPI000377581C|nr:bifunctional ADP-dependent NAD(P)H-hydrate dehydratase/NAD(P)H-hydrate epimerase [Effusibacillus pohliae]
MYVVTSGEMRALDRYAIEAVGIPSLVLMENAGREVARQVHDYFYGEKKAWLLLAGKGNNGGDAIVAARHLAEWGHRVQIVYAEPPERLAGDAAIQRTIAEKMGIASCVFKPDAIDWRGFDGVVDGLLGTGAKGAPREPYAALIREANASGLPIFAIDIPSGLDADTGAVYDPCIRAVRTITLAFLKRGLVQYPGKTAAGDVTVAAIGIPESLADRHGVQTFLLNDRTLRQRLAVDPSLPREADTHKGTYGHVLIAAGSRRMSGAGILCAKAALRAGCGLVTWAVPDRLVDPLLGHVPEVMLVGVPDEGRGDWTATSPQDLLALASGKDAVAIGPGLDRFVGGERWMQVLWEGVACPLVLDADALNMIAGVLEKWPRRQAPTVMTPHPGEMARLVNGSVWEVQADRIGVARRFAMRHGVALVLKGAQTVVATPEGAAYINTTGNPGMATGGTGDVLTGIITGLLAQGLDAEQAACLGVYLHGRAGDEAAARFGMHGMLAGDMIDIPFK